MGCIFVDDKKTAVNQDIIDEAKNDSNQSDEKTLIDKNQ
jgi:hypothetical protein